MALFRPGTRLTNLLHAVLLIGLMAVIAAMIGWLLLGEAAVVWVVFMVVFGLSFSRNAPINWILALLRAVPLGHAQWAEGYVVIEELSRRANLSYSPRLYYLANSVPNAISLGQGKDSAIVITDGLLRLLNEREMIGVLAHELSHFRTHDIGLMTLAAMLANLTFLMAFSGLLLVVLSFPLYWMYGQTPSLLLILLLGLAPHAVTLLTLVLSRTREFDADQGAVGLTDDPTGLASALDKLDRLQGSPWDLVFMNKKRASPWLQSHPATRERIRRLLGL